MPTIGISLIAHNEEEQIRQALESASFADQIVAVNCESTDRTREIIMEFPQVTIFDRKNNPNLNQNKTFAFEQLTTDWIFYLDPDERIPPDLRDRIRNAANEKPVAFKIPRKNFFFGRWLEHGGQYPDYQLRFFKRGFAKFPNRHVHESLEVTGEIGTIREPFEHIPYPSVSSFLKKMNFYTTFQADFWEKDGMKSSLWRSFRFFLFRPISRFLRRYFFLGGFRDGWQGYLAALGDAFQIAVSWAKFLHGSKR